MPSGIIIKGIGGFYYIKTTNGIYECKARGIFRKDDQKPLIGDRVTITVIDDKNMLGSLDVIEPRQSYFVRPMVANVDQMAIVAAVKSPTPDYILLDKLLITCEVKKIKPVICINKVDLDDSKECEYIESAYSKAGYKTVSLSSVMNIGFDKLKSVLKDKITVFAGQSGVGKSTILNNIMSSMVMKTGSVSEKIERGKHTTRHAELIDLEDGGFIVDTPGFSSFELDDIEYTELELYYPEFVKYQGSCRFTGCSHISEPDCAIKKALNTGEIDMERYNRYVCLYIQLKSKPKDYGKNKNSR